MKRGRPSKRGTIRRAVLEILGQADTPLTTSALSRLVSERVGGVVSWNTTQKYVRELVESNVVQPIILPHSKLSGKGGLTVYILKR